MEHKVELMKLSHGDRKTLFQMMDDQPEDIRQWIKQLAIEYQQKDIIIDVDKFYKEVAAELPKPFSR